MSLKEHKANMKEFKKTEDSFKELKAMAEMVEKDFQQLKDVLEISKQISESGFPCMDLINNMSKEERMEIVNRALNID